MGTGDRRGKAVSVASCFSSGSPFPHGWTGESPTVVPLLVLFFAGPDGACKRVYSHALSLLQELRPDLHQHCRPGPATPAGFLTLLLTH